MTNLKMGKVFLAIQMAKKNMEKMSIVINHKKILKTSMKYYLMTTRMAIIRKNKEKEK